MCLPVVNSFKILTVLLFPSGFVSYFCSTKRSTEAGKRDAGYISKANQEPKAKSRRLTPITLNEIKTLIWKEVTLEWRQKYALSGMLLYVVSTVFVCYLSFNLRRNQLTPIVWNTLLWIILLFTAVNAIAKSFSQERHGRLLYYYNLCSPQAIIISKIIYNSLVMVVLSGLGFIFYAFVMGNPVQDNGLFVICILLASIGFASVLTLIAGIASKADNSATLMAVLSFPIILPMLLMTIRLAKNALDGLDWSVSTDEITTLLSIDLIVITLSYLLFPYLWKS